MATKTWCPFGITIPEKHQLPLQRNALRCESPVDDSDRCRLRPLKQRGKVPIDRDRWVASGGHPAGVFGKCFMSMSEDYHDCLTYENNRLESENILKEEQYQRALKSISKLRNEILVYRDERQQLFDALQELKREYLQKGNSYQQAAALSLAYVRLQKRRLI